MNKIEISREKLVELAVKAGFEQLDDQIIITTDCGARLVYDDELIEFARLLIDEIKNPKSASDDWIAWTGGECPVPVDTKVEVRLRNGSLDQGDAVYFYWDHDDIDGDIVAYRVVDED